jgi:hypothetical protein
MRDRRNARARFCLTCDGTGSLVVRRPDSYLHEQITCPACFGDGRAEWRQRDDEREPPSDEWIGLALFCLASLLLCGVAFAAYAFVRGWWG